MRRRTWARWVVAFTLGELVGFGGVAVAAGAIGLWLTSGLQPAARALTLYAIAVLGGIGEGAVLGWFQMKVLRHLLPRLDAGRWIRATAAAAALAWALGMLAPTLDDLVGLPTAIQVVIWIPAGAVILLSIGTAQALVLRGIVDRPARWVGANVLGWLAGLPWTFALPAALPDGAPMPIWVATFVVAGLLMGLTAGAITGLALTGFLKRQASSPAADGQDLRLTARGGVASGGESKRRKAPRT